MIFVIAPDKFRGSLSAPEAADAMARGVRSVMAEAEIREIPMADGGEGTVEALVSASKGTFREARVTGPLGEPVMARYGWLGDGETAVLEMATASGLALIPLESRDPMRASTIGTGELLASALKERARRIILGIGGSATNDGGAGLAQALGFRLLDANGNELLPGGGSLDRLNRIIRPDRDPIGNTEILVACDVDNPLCGHRGASRVFGPQKGATEAMVAKLDANLAHFASIIERDLGVDVCDRPGAGAAGGLGAGLMAFAKAKLRPGVELVIEILKLSDRLLGADLVLTGEGSIDFQTASGKTAVGVARLARSQGIPVIALAGTIGPGAEAVHAEGIDAYFTLCPGPIPLAQAIADAAPLLQAATAEAVRLFLSARKSRV